MWKVALLLVGVATLSGSSIIQHQNHRPWARPAKVRPFEAPEGVTAHNFTQRLDHFNPSQKRTWEQRYMKDGPFFGADETSGPVFIMLGGHEAISQGVLERSHALELAKNLKGIAFLLEHRFYGQSIPTEDMKVENLRYLSQDQALADVAYFIQHLRTTKQIPESSKVVLYGGLHAGNLAAWARIKYPDLVYASVASSAPLSAKVAFPEYFDKMMVLLAKKGGPECRANVEAVVQYVDAELKVFDGTMSLARTFRLCYPFGKRAWDGEMLFNRIALTVKDMAVQGEDVVMESCYILAQPSPKDKAGGLAMAGGFGMNDMQCEDVDYNKSIANAKKEAWGQAVDAYGEQLYDRTKLYQACFEYGQFHTLSTDWMNHYPVELALQTCADVFGTAFNKMVLEKAVDRTNREFGAAKPHLSRVVFVHGEDDPYAVLGVQESLNEQAPAIEIPGALECQDVAKTTGLDSLELKAARVKITQYLVKWTKLDQ